ncbi:hypothetical protein HN615_08000 [Candidatus Woesearchaeota archaeon]|jgi:hypothetical protein|nr:hypothetical protein [Candidatus Woesearchaeota archaeon]
MKLIKFVFKILVILFVIVVLIGIFTDDEGIVTKEPTTKENVVSTSISCTEYGNVSNCSINELMELNLKLSKKVVNCKESYGVADYKNKCKSTVELSNLASKKMTFLMNEIAKIPEDDAIKKDYISIKYGEW